MATRFRLRDAILAPAINIPFDAAWNEVTGAVRRTLQAEQPLSNSITDTVTTSKSVVGASNFLNTQFVVEGLLAQTISGTVKGQARCSETSGLLDAYPQVIIKVFDPVNMVDRGTLLSPLTVALSGTPGAEGYEHALSATNRKLPSGWSGAGKSLSSVDAEDGDMLVIEVGSRHHEAAVTSRSVTYNWYRAVGSSSDAPEDETTTSVIASWFEFSHDFLIVPEAIPYGGRDQAIEIRPTGSTPLLGQVWPRGAGQG